jgi:hypothetical protein
MAFWQQVKKMKKVIKKALIKAALSFAGAFILVTVLQYIPLLKPSLIDDLVNSPMQSETGYIINRQKAIDYLGWEVPWFLYLWPFNHPSNFMYGR